MRRQLKLQGVGRLPERLTLQQKTDTHAVGYCIRYACGETCVGCGDEENGHPLGLCKSNQNGHTDYHRRTIYCEDWWERPATPTQETK